MEDRSRDKVSAIYELREAAENKARAEAAVDANPLSREAKDALLDAQLHVEAKTHEAIEICHECGHNHDPEHGHVGRTATGNAGANVLDVDFRQSSERG